MTSVIAIYILISLVVAHAVVRDEINMNGKDSKVKLILLFVSSAVFWPLGLLAGAYDSIKGKFKSRSEDI